MKFGQGAQRGATRVGAPGETAQGLQWNADVMWRQTESELAHPADRPHLGFSKAYPVCRGLRVKRVTSLRDSAVGLNDAGFATVRGQSQVMRILLQDKRTPVPQVIHACLP